MSAAGRYSGSTPRFGLGFAFVLVALFAAVMGGTPAAMASPGDPVIVTESGHLQGTVSAQMIEYLGIPYAAPPVGMLRWMPPESFGKWTGVFDATAFGSECPQNNTSGTAVGNENCLFLNIYTPHGAKTVKPHGRAVMVWIHGGGLTAGAGADYDPTPLVERGHVIVVTINYRIGHARLLCPAGARRRRPLGRQLRLYGPAICARVGAKKHRGFWRRPGPRHHLRRICWGAEHL